MGSVCRMASEAKHLFIGADQTPRGVIYVGGNVARVSQRGTKAVQCLTVKTDLVLRR